MSEESVEEVIEEKPTVEVLAEKMGWSPQDKWRGDPEQWKPADEFILASREIQDRKSSEIHHLKGDLKSLKETMEGMAANFTAQTRKALQEQRKRLQAEFDEAVDNGDKEGARRASTALREVDSQETKDDDQTRLLELWQPHAVKFESAHAEVLKDPEAEIRASELIQKLAQRGHTPEETYEIVGKSLKREFPEYFTNPNRESPPKVSGETRPTSSDRSAWGRLLKESPEVKGIFAEFVEQGIYKDTKEDRERYAKLALED
jgi:predicted  nucleic acid-binding Zn-ribbon protein